MKIITGVVTDRGSRYAVSGGPVTDRAGIDAYLKDLTRPRKFARASHHSWALLLAEAGQHHLLRHDGGEAGAGDIIARMIERAGLANHIVVVTRWYGGVNLGGDRFRHITTCVRAYLASLR